MTEHTRAQVFALIRAHLADELDVEESVIGEETRFKDDLEADSLDLYTLVQELEDTYGVSMSDEQAAQILTVGQAVDFVLAHAPAGGGANGGGLDGGPAGGGRPGEDSEVGLPGERE
jgi:acyl carrier protein